MALTTATDISFVLSGGTDNLDPNLSLGGDPSTTPIINNTINNLYDDISPDEAEDGHEDYRCLYIFNDGDTTIYSVNFFIEEDFADGASIEIGIENRDETQRITMGAIPTDGSMTLSYEGVSFVSAFNADLGQWALSIEAALNALMDGDEPLLQEVEVTAEVSGSSTIFDIHFSGIDGKRNHSDVVIEDNSIVPSMNINISTPQRGAPINTIAPQINSEAVPPGGVSFFVAISSVPISVPKLMPGDGFPVWIKRTIDAGVTAVASDGVILRFESEAIAP